MINLDKNEIRESIKRTNPECNFDEKYTFYYDETNNIRKFYLNNSGFNSEFSNNFVLGGVLHENSESPDVQPLINELNLQESMKEIKFKYIARGNFVDCLKSKRLRYFLSYVNDSDLYAHCSEINLLYWSIVDIVDSVVGVFGDDEQIDKEMINLMKNDFYKLVKSNIKLFVSLFYKYKYPNINAEQVAHFVDEINVLIKNQCDNMGLHLGLEVLRQLLKSSKKKNSLPFIQNEENGVLVENFSHSYYRPIYMFNNSIHIFDEENYIEKLLSDYENGDERMKDCNFSFVDSKSNRMVQLSDVLVGVLGKLSSYLNTTDREKIYSDLKVLSLEQKENISLFLELIDKSHDKNPCFFHTIDSEEEMSKIEIIYDFVC